MGVVQATARSRVGANVWVYQRELEQFFRAHDAACGLKSNFTESILIEAAIQSAKASYRGPCPHKTCAGEPCEECATDVNAIAMMVKSMHTCNVDAPEDAMIRYCDNRARAKEFRVTRQALERLSGRHAVVLNLLFGDPTPGVYPPGFGDVQAIVHLTDVAYEVHEDVAAEASDQHMAKLGIVFDDTAMERRREMLVEEFWRAATRRAKKPDTAEMQNRIMKAALVEYHRESPLIRAVTGACAHADREWDERKAIHHLLTYRGPRTSDGKPAKAAHDAWRVDANMLTARLRISAEKLRTEAMAAYGAAR